MTRSDVDKVIDAVCKYFNIDLKSMSLKEEVEFYLRIYHSVNIQ